MNTQAGARAKSVIDDWIRSTEISSQKMLRLKQIYELQYEFLFNQYEPVNADPVEAALPFISRLDRWLEGFITPEDKWAAFHSLRYFFFVGQKETTELYRCAVQHKLLPWLVDKERLDIFDPKFEQKLNLVMKQTWPCPVTDSLRINSLLHQTGLPGQKIRPDWLSQSVLGDQNLKNFVKKKSIKYLVLFEDFVGSGKQCETATDYALQAFEGQILVVPLIICHHGDMVLRKLVDKSKGRLTYNPVIVLGADCLIGPDPTLGEPASFDELRTAINNVQKSAKFSDGPNGRDGIGSLMSSYSNCPNNTPPIYHATRKNWPHPLFPREGRV